MILLTFLCLIEVKDINHVTTISGVGEITKESFSKVAVSEIVQIIIKHGPNKIAESAFTACTSLQILNVSLSIPDIPPNAFTSLSNTLFINVPEDHLTLSNDVHGALYNKNKTILIHVPRKLQSFQIPETVEVIKSISLQKCRFQSLNIPSKIRLIESNAFHTATIRELTFDRGSNELTIVGSFQWAGVTIVHIPASCVKIGQSSFLHAGVNSFIFDDIEESNLTIIEDECFVGFKGKSIKLPQKVTSIPAKCFQNSPNLEEVNIPRDCTDIHLTAFTECPKLTRISVDTSNQNFTDIQGSIYNKAKTKLFFIPPSSPFLELPKELEDIGASILQSCPGLKEINTGDNENFYFEGGVLYNRAKDTVVGACGGITAPSILDIATKVRESAFSSSKFTNISFSRDSRLEVVGVSAFSKCDNLEIVYLPKNLRSLGNNAFEGCNNLIEVLFEPDCPLNYIGWKTFHCSIVRITIPRNVAIIGSYTFNGPIENVTLLPNNSLGQIHDSSFRGCSYLKHFSNPCNLTKIAAYSFFGCSRLEFPFHEAIKLSDIGALAFAESGVKEVSFCSSLGSLGEMAFLKCRKLTTVTFAEDITLTSLPSSVFIQCDQLKKIILSKHISDLEYSAFSGCSQLTNIYCSYSTHLKNINEIIYKDSEEKGGKLILILCPPGKLDATIDVNTIDMKPNCFRGCSLLTKVIFNEKSTLERVKEYTFSGCSKLSNITLPKSVLEVEANSFSDCVSLKKLPLLANCSINAISTSCFKNSGIEFLKIPDNVEIIENNCFAGCKNLKEVTIGSEIKSIGSEVFFNCPILKSIRYCGKKDVSKGADVIGNTNFIIDVSIFYETPKFGSNLVRKSLDPECSLITEWKLKEESNSLFLFMPLISEEDNSDATKAYWAFNERD